MKKSIALLLLTLSACTIKQDLNQNQELFSGLFISGTDFSKIESPHARIDAWATCTIVYRILKESEGESSHAKILYSDLEGAYKMVLTEEIYSNLIKKSKLDALLSTLRVMSAKGNQLRSWLEVATTEIYKKTTYVNSDQICRLNADEAIRILKTGFLDWEQSGLDKSILDLSNTLKKEKS